MAEGDLPGTGVMTVEEAERYLKILKDINDQAKELERTEKGEGEVYEKYYQSKGEIILIQIESSWLTIFCFVDVKLGF